MSNELKGLEQFIGTGQRMALVSALRGEEAEYFRDKLRALRDVVDTMPRTYEQDGKGDDAIAYLHYFTGGWDWYITERDAEDEQLQAFGLVSGFDVELGYVSLPEVLAAGAEIDLHWTPKTIGELREELVSA